MSADRLRAALEKIDTLCDERGEVFPVLRASDIRTIVRTALAADAAPDHDGSSWDCVECGTNVTGPSVALPCPKCGGKMVARDRDKIGALEAALRGLACHCRGDSEGHEASEHLSPGEREVFVRVSRGADAAAPRISHPQPLRAQR